MIDASNIGAAVFIRDPDGQVLELLPMAYRRHLDEQGYRVSEIVVTGLGPGDRRKPSTS